MGYFLTVNFLIFPFYSYLFIGYYRLGILGMAISLGILEIASALILISLYLFVIDRRVHYTPMQHGILYKIGWFIKEIIISDLIFCPDWICYEFMVYFASYTNSKEDVYIFTLLATLLVSMDSSITGIVVFMLSEINK